MLTIAYRTMFKVALVVLLLQIASHDVTCLVVLPNNTSDKLDGSRYNKVLLPDTSNNSIRHRQHTYETSHDIRGKHNIF